MNTRLMVPAIALAAGLAACADMPQPGVPKYGETAGTVAGPSGVPASRIDPARP